MVVVMAFWMVMVSMMMVSMMMVMRMKKTIDFFIIFFVVCAKGSDYYSLTLIVGEGSR